MVMGLIKLIQINLVCVFGYALFLYKYSSVFYCKNVNKLKYRKRTEEFYFAKQKKSSWAMSTPGKRSMKINN